MATDVYANSPPRDIFETICLSNAAANEKASNVMQGNVKYNANNGLTISDFTIGGYLPEIEDALPASIVTKFPGPYGFRVTVSFSTQIPAGNSSLPNVVILLYRRGVNVNNPSTSDNPYYKAILSFVSAGTYIGKANNIIVSYGDLSPVSLSLPSIKIQNGITVSIENELNTINTYIGTSLAKIDTTSKNVFPRDKYTLKVYQATSFVNALVINKFKIMDLIYGSVKNTGEELCQYITHFYNMYSNSDRAGLVVTTSTEYNITVKPNPDTDSSIVNVLCQPVYTVFQSSNTRRAGVRIECKGDSLSFVILDIVDINSTSGNRLQMNIRLQTSRMATYDNTRIITRDGYINPYNKFPTFWNIQFVYLLNSKVFLVYINDYKVFEISAKPDNFNYVTITPIVPNIPADSTSNSSAKIQESQIVPVLLMRAARLYTSESLIFAPDDYLSVPLENFYDNLVLGILVHNTVKSLKNAGFQFSNLSDNTQVYYLDKPWLTARLFSGISPHNYTNIARVSICKLNISVSRVSNSNTPTFSVQKNTVTYTKYLNQYPSNPLASASYDQVFAVVKPNDSSISELNQGGTVDPIEIRSYASITSGANTSTSSGVYNIPVIRPYQFTLFQVSAPQISNPDTICLFYRSSVQMKVHSIETDEEIQDISGNVGATVSFYLICKSVDFTESPYNTEIWPFIQYTVATSATDKIEVQSFVKQAFKRNDYEYILVTVRLKSAGSRMQITSKIKPFCPLFYSDFTHIYITAQQTIPSIVFYVDSASSTSTSISKKVGDTFTLRVNTSLEEVPSVSGTGTSKVVLSNYQKTTVSGKHNTYLHSYTAEVKGSGSWPLTFSYASNTSRTATTATFTVQASKKNIGMHVYSDNKDYWTKDRVEGTGEYTIPQSLILVQKPVNSKFYVIVNTNYPDGEPTLIGPSNTTYKKFGSTVSSCTKSTISNFSNILNTDCNYTYNFFYAYQFQCVNAGEYTLDLKYNNKTGWNDYNYSTDNYEEISIKVFKTQRYLNFIADNGIGTEGHYNDIKIGQQILFILNSSYNDKPRITGDGNNTVKVSNPTSSTTAIDSNTFLYPYVYKYIGTVKSSGDHTLKFYYNSDTAYEGATVTAIVHANRYTPTMAAYFNGSSRSSTSVNNAMVGSDVSCTIVSSENVAPSVTGTSNSTITYRAGTSSGKNYPYTFTPVVAGTHNITFKYSVSGDRDSATLPISITAQARPTKLNVYFKEGNTKTNITGSSNTKNCKVGDVFYLVVDGESVAPEVTSPNNYYATCSYQTKTGTSYTYVVSATGLCSSADNIEIKFSYDDDGKKREAKEVKLKLVIQQRQGQIMLYTNQAMTTQATSYTANISSTFTLYVKTGESDSPTLTFDRNAISTGTSVTTISAGVYSYTIQPLKSGDYTITFSYSDNSGTRNIPSKTFTVHANKITPVLEIYDKEDADKFSKDSTTYTTHTHRDVPNTYIPVLVRGIANEKPGVSTSPPGVQCFESTTEVAKGMYWYSLNATQSGNYQFTAQYDSSATRAAVSRTMNLVIDPRVSSLVIKRMNDSGQYVNVQNNQIQCFAEDTVKIQVDSTESDTPRVEYDRSSSTFVVNTGTRTQTNSTYHHNFELTPLTAGTYNVDFIYDSSSSRTASAGLLTIGARVKQQANSFESVYTYQQESKNFSRDKIDLKNPGSNTTTARSLTMSNGETRYLYYEETDRENVRPVLTHYPTLQSGAVTIENVSSSTYVTLQGFPTSIPENTNVYKIKTNTTFTNHTIKASLTENKYYYGNEDFFILNSEDRVRPNMSFSTSTAIATTCTGISVVEGKSFNLYVASNVDRKPDSIENTSSIGYSYSSTNSFKNGNRHVWCYAVTAPEGSSDHTITFSYLSKLHGGSLTPNYNETKTFTLSTLPDKVATTVEIRKDNATSAQITASTTVEVLTEFKLIIKSNRTDAPEITGDNFVINYDRSMGKVHYFTLMANTVSAEGYVLNISYPESDELKRLSFSTNITIIVKAQKIQPKIQFSAANAPSVYKGSFTVNFGESFDFLVTSNMTERPEYYSKSTATLTEGSSTGTVYAYTFPMAPAGSYVLKFGYEGNNSVKEYYNTVLVRVKGDNTSIWSEGDDGSNPFDSYISSNGGSAALVMQRDSDKIWHTTTIIDGDGNRVSADFPSVRITSSAKTALATFVSGMPLASDTSISGS